MLFPNQFTKQWETMIRILNRLNALLIRVVYLENLIIFIVSQEGILHTNRQSLRCIIQETWRNEITSRYIDPRSFQDATHIHIWYRVRYLSFCYVCKDSTYAWHSGATSVAMTAAWMRRFRIRQHQPGSSSSPRWPRKPWTWLTHDHRWSLAKDPYYRPFIRRRNSTRLVR